MKKSIVFLVVSLLLNNASFAQLKISESKPIKGPLAEYIGKQGFSLGTIGELLVGHDTLILFSYPDAMTNYDKQGSFHFKKRADAKELWALVGKMLADPDETKKYDIEINTGMLKVSKSKKAVLILNIQTSPDNDPLKTEGTIFKIDQKIYDKLNVL